MFLSPDRQKLLHYSLTSSSSADGCVAKTGDGLVELAIVLTVSCPIAPVHEPQVPIQMASLPIRHHSALRPVVSAVSAQHRNLEEMMLERRLTVDYTTVYRWVQAYAPELEKRCRPHLKPTNDSWRVDETYIKVKGKWKYLYRAVDSTGNTIDFMLSAKRDAHAAERFFHKALKAFHNQKPRVINVDKNAAYPITFEQLKTK